MIPDRLARLRQKMQELGVDTFMVTQPENRRYLSGFTGSAGVLFITQKASLIAADFRYYEQSQQEAPLFELVKIEDKFEELLPRVLERLGSRKVAFEGDHLTYDAYSTYRQAIPEQIELVSTKDVVRWLRAVKEPEEIATIRKAVALTDRAFDILREMMRPGMIERELAWKLEQEMRQAGAEKLSFDVILAGGPASAMAHAKASERPLQAGQPIVIDTGCMWQGYCSDLTRTVILGEPDERFMEIYGIVQQAQERAEANIRAGMKGSEAHALAEEVIERAGYGDAFGHGLGHGVGLAIHELPVLSPLSDHTLEAGMVFSVEPGIYISGWGGVRIEDLVLLTEQGVEVLSQAKKEPVIPLR
ncbi:MAG: M24 family metallopeptidase [Anaerolineae bacterium]